MNNIIVIACKLTQEIPDIPADYIGVDKGALFLLENKKEMIAAIGDFDSVSFSELEFIKNNVDNILKFDAEKDYSDLELAINYAISLKYDHIIITGAIGSRIDHTYNSINLLDKFKDYDITFRDSKNKVFLLNKGIHMISKSHYKYFSFFPLEKSKLSLIGFKYELFDYVVDRDFNIGLSNEIPNNFATIKLDFGKLLCMQCDE